MYGLVRTAHLLGRLFLRKPFPEHENDGLALARRQSIDCFRDTELRAFRRTPSLAVIGFAQRCVDFSEFPFSPRCPPYRVFDFAALGSALRDSQKRISENVIFVVPAIGFGFGDLSCDFVRIEFSHKGTLILNRKIIRDASSSN